MTKTHIRLSNGKLVDLMNPKEEDIDLFSATRSLNEIRRFTGHWKERRPLTVAQHTLLTVGLCKVTYPDDTEAELDCLIHDMPESWYNDISTPQKRSLSLAGLTGPIDTVFYSRLWKHPTPYNDEIKKKRKEMDALALAIEQNSMWGEEIRECEFSLQECIDIFESYAQIEFVDLEAEYENLMAAINVNYSFDMAVEKIKNG